LTLTTILPFRTTVMHRRILLAAAVLLLPIDLDGRQAAEAEVRGVVRALFDGMRRGDSAVVRSLFHARARMLTVTDRPGPGGVQVEETPDAFVRAVGTPRAEVWDERTFNEQVRIDGPLASVWMDYTFYRGTTMNHCGVNHFLLVREGAAWKIVELADTRRREGCITDR
jgi:hypothetical protein